MYIYYIYVEESIIEELISDGATHMHARTILALSKSSN